MFDVPVFVRAGFTSSSNVNIDKNWELSWRLYRGAALATLHAFVITASQLQQQFLGESQGMRNQLRHFIKESPCGGYYLTQCVGTARLAAGNTCSQNTHSAFFHNQEGSHHPCFL